MEYKKLDKYQMRNWNDVIITIRALMSGDFER